MIDVVVGVLKQQTSVLVSLRQAHQDLSGFWEFPGGKLEAGESFEQALRREFQEEVGVETDNWQPLITIPWDYGKKQVRLHVFVSDSFSGEAHGKEGQLVKWQPIDRLDECHFPPANKGIIHALNLADTFMVMGSAHDTKDALARLESALKSGLQLILLKPKTFDEETFIDFACQAIALAHQNAGVKVILSGKPDWLKRLPEADGIQLSASHIHEWVERPIAEDKLLFVSTHNAVDMAKAVELQADAILLSPVKKTAAHPELEAIGWQGVQDWVQNMPVPVYAYGGMQPKDMLEAKGYGAQGIATARGLWPEPI